MLRFSPRLKKGNYKVDAEIVIDWIGWIDLHDRDEDVDESLSLTLRRVPLWKSPWVYLKHPDPAVRLSGWMGWASTFLGMLSLYLALPSDWLGRFNDWLFAHIEIASDWLKRITN